MHKIVALIFAGGRVKELSVLTESRAKAAVIYGGGFHSVDFALTNLANSGIGKVGILAQYRPASLMEHVGIGMPWDLVGANRGVQFLSPYTGPENEDWYRGPADAIYQNIDFIERNSPEDVLIVSGDQAYKMDYQRLISFHQERAADFTMAFKEIDNNPSRYGIGELNAIGQLVNFTEKPKYPKTNLVNLGVYLFKKQVLIDELKRTVAGEDEAAKSNQIHEVIRRLIARRSAYGWIFDGEWYNSRTLDDYLEFHRSLLGNNPKIDLTKWDVRSSSTKLPTTPTRILPGATVENAHIANGCVIEGTVRNSVLSPGVIVEKGAVVNDSVLWNDVIVREGAKLDRVISDKRTVFGSSAEVGIGDSAPSEEMPESLTCGASVFGIEVKVPDGAKIGRNCIIHPKVGEEELNEPLASGKSVSRNK